MIFSFVAVLHAYTGRWARLDDTLRRCSVLILWVVAFYLGTLGLAALAACVLPSGLAALMVFASIPAGGFAGWLCLRGKLPGSRKPPPPANHLRASSGGKETAAPAKGTAATSDE